MGIKQVLSAPRSPWQRAYVERVIGSIRRECLDHVVVFNERSLRRILSSYCAYYGYWRTHLSLHKDAPETRTVQPESWGEIVDIPKLVVCIIITNGELRDRLSRLLADAQLLTRGHSGPASARFLNSSYPNPDRLAINIMQQERTHS